MILEKGFLMRRIIIFLIAVLIGMSAFIIGENSGETLAQGEKKIRVLTSFYPMYIMALNVTKGVPEVSVTNLTPQFTGCLHDYALTTEDMRKIANADIFVANGAGMETFLDKIIGRYPRLKVVKLATGIAFIKEGKEINPHVWVGISNAIIEVKNLGKALEELDPLHRDFYQKNVSIYVAKLEALKNKMHVELGPYKGKQIITFHEAFPYFAEEFDLKIAATVEREPGSEPNAKELAEIIDLVRKAGIKTLFSEPQYSNRAVEAIARETGAKVYKLDPAATGPDDPDAYIRIMEDNLEVLKKDFSLR